MFPNIRLMIAAIVASIVALSCGFGVFAAFRVNHEPLVRLPPITAPLQLIAGNAACVAVAGGTFDRRFQTSPPQSAARPDGGCRARADDREACQSAPAASAAVRHAMEVRLSESRMTAGACRRCNQPTVRYCRRARERPAGFGHPAPETAATAAADVQDSALGLQLPAAAVEPDSKSDAARRRAEPGAAPSVRHRQSGERLAPGLDKRRRGRASKSQRCKPGAESASPEAVTTNQ